MKLSTSAQEKPKQFQALNSSNGESNLRYRRTVKCCCTGAAFKGGERRRRKGTMRGLKDKVAIVTGGLGDLGYAAAQRLVEEGCRLSRFALQGEQEGQGGENGRGV